MKVLFVCFFVAVPVQAQEIIDHDLLFRQYADKVVTATDSAGSMIQRLDMGDGVTVTCGPEGCVGMDENGAIGCTFSIMSELRAMAQACPSLLSVPDAAVFDRIYERVGTFVAANAVPPRSWPELSAQMDAAAAQSVSGSTPSICSEAMAPGSDIRHFFDAFLAPDMAADLNEVLSVPRLPVMNPCL